MQVFLATAGSRGDVDPFLALARRGGARGWDMHLAVTREFVDDAVSTGATVHVLDGDYATLVAAQGVAPGAALRTYRTTIAPMLAAIERSAAIAITTTAPEVVLAHPKLTTAPAAARVVGATFVLCEIVPTLTPTRAFAAAGITTRDLGPLNPLTFRALQAGAGLAAVAARRRAVRDTGLPLSRPDVPARVVMPVSPVLLPPPADWPDRVVVTGAWTAPRPSAEPDPELDAFLAGGDVLYAGFGSMRRGDPISRARVIVDVARASGLRILVVTGWGGLAVPDDRRGDDVLVRPAVDHESVLPRCTAAVHHAGAGTAHAIVAAGVPSVPVPFLVDQPFWANRLHTGGLSGPSIAGSRLTAQRLEASLDALPRREALAGPAARLGAEDGCATTLDLLAELGSP